MNKKLLICGAIATSLLLSACVKKETPAEEETRAEAPATQPKAEEKFENLTPTEPEQPAPTAEEPTPARSAQKVEVIREETPNTTTEIRRETRPVQAEPKPQVKAEAPKAEPKPQVKAETPKAEPKPQAETPRSSGNPSQDDAVAAAIAAATPALD